MSAGVLELVDTGVTIGDAAGALVESPAYAILEPNSVVLGDAARARARLQPRRTHTHFWQRLGTEPLHDAPPHARHHADLAWQHLQQLHALAGRPAELILAVPGNFTREQLALLLGIAERCEFRAVGLVDSALAAATQVPTATAVQVHLDLQLHQCVLTRIERDDGELARNLVHTLPGTGMLDLQERWARRVAAAFIQQTRFDPLHDAASEQQLYDQLPEWLSRLDAADDTLAELRIGAHRHQAKLRTAELLEAVQPQYAELLEALAREAADGGVLLSTRIARLPRFTRLLPDARVLAADAPVRGALRYIAQIRCEDRALRFVTRLPAPPAPQPASTAAPVGNAVATPLASAVATPATIAPTHLLNGNRALPLALPTVQVRRDEDGEWRLGAPRATPGWCTLTRIDGSWFALPVPGRLLRIDGLAVSGRTPVQAGTRLEIEGAPEMRLIVEVRADDPAA